MSKFDAATEVDDLSYDFTKFSSAPDAKGDIPEPSSDQVNDFNEVLKKMYPTKIDDEGKIVPDIDAIKELVDKADELEDEVFLALSMLCSGVMEPDTIKSLPFRVQRAFFGWITGVFNPQL